MFSQQDYEQNPGKYQLFSTAVVARSHKKSPYRVGTVVSIKYYDARPNHVLAGGALQPVYLVNDTDLLYAAALKDFVL